MRKLGIQLGGFILTGLLLWGVLAWRDRQLVKTIRAEMGIAARDTAIAKQTAEVARVDTVYQTELKEYPVYRDRLINANPGNKPLEDLAKRCNQVILSCDQRIKASDVLADSLRAQVKNLKQMKALTPRRFSAFTEGAYDFIHREPVLRGGGEMRVVGPLSLTVTGEASMGLDASRQRVLVGARFTFK